MRIFTNEEKLKAIELYIKYDFSPGAVMYELGYPTARSMIYRWYKAYKANGNSLPTSRKSKSKYTDEQKHTAVEYYLTHGKSIKKTITALGYPGSTCLCDCHGLFQRHSRKRRNSEAQAARSAGCRY